MVHCFQLGLSRDQCNDCDKDRGSKKRMPDQRFRENDGLDNSLMFVSVSMLMNIFICLHDRKFPLWRRVPELLHSQGPELTCGRHLDPFAMVRRTLLRDRIRIVD